MFIMYINKISSYLKEDLSDMFISLLLVFNLKFIF